MHQTAPPPNSLVSIHTGPSQFCKQHCCVCTCCFLCLQCSSARYHCGSFPSPPGLPKGPFLIRFSLSLTVKSVAPFLLPSSWHASSRLIFSLYAYLYYRCKYILQFIYVLCFSVIWLLYWNISSTRAGIFAVFAHEFIPNTEKNAWHITV